MIRVVIADDQELIRESLKIVLGTHNDIQVVGVAGDGFEVLDILKREKVDVILMDIRMPRMDGVICTKSVKEQFPDVKIIVLTTFDDDDFVFSALKYGASGYLLKGVGMDEMKAPRVKTRGIFHASLCDAAIFSCITAYTQNLVYLALSHILL